MKTILVSIIMGSDSDLSVMQEAAQILEEFSVPYELTLVSAHRTPARMFMFAKQAHTRGIKVIIAGAGGAAHLPGMVASLTPLPVIGVPVQTKTMNGLDSLYSIVQMPPGIPVATMAINGANNAGLLAVRILSLNNTELTKQYLRYMEKIESKVLTKVKSIETKGFVRYLAEKK